MARGSNVEIYVHFAEEVYRGGGTSTDALLPLGGAWVWLMDKELRVFGD